MFAAFGNEGEESMSEISTNQQVTGLSDATKLMQYDANKKRIGVAYLLWFFLGMFGAHRFYLGQTGSGVAILILTVVSILLSFVMIGFVLLLVPWIWVIVDAFLIPGMARDHNNKLIQSLR